MAQLTPLAKCPEARQYGYLWPCIMYSIWPTTMGGEDGGGGGSGVKG